MKHSVRESPNEAISQTLCEKKRNLIRFYMNGRSEDIFEEAKMAFIKVRSPNLTGRTEIKKGNFNHRSQDSKWDPFYNTSMSQVVAMP
jgi:hypothetical protein